jgi:integrase
MLVRVKGVKKVRAKGRLYYYHRATGTRLSGAPGSPEFLAEIAALERRAKDNGPLPGTLAALAVAYKRSPEFGDLAPRTKRDYDRVLESLAPIGNTPLVRFDASLVYGLRDEAFKAHGRRFANYTVQVLRLVMTWGERRSIVTDNPARGVKQIRRPRGMAPANRPWTDAERQAVLDSAPLALRLPIALGMYAGLREDDALRLPWSAYDGSAIATVAAKTGDALWIPAHRDLRAILSATPRAGVIMALNSRGRPWTGSGFRASFFKLIRALHAAGKVGPGLTFHGLRHTVGMLVIDAGGDTRDVAAMLGHRSEAMAEHYSRGADHKKRATATVRRLENYSDGTKFSK